MTFQTKATLSQPERLCAIDLFAGAGGLSEGLRQAGYNVVAAVENDELACEAFRLNHPSTKLWQQDIRNVTGPQILKALGLERGELSLLAACPPCQGFSSLRTRNGKYSVRDPDNQLIMEVLRLVRSIKPQRLMVENVPALQLDRRFKLFCRCLGRLGYEVQWSVLNTAHFGVPQRRKRLVLLASRVSSPEFAEPEMRARNVRDAIAHLELTSASNDLLHNYDSRRSAKVEDMISRIPRDGGSRHALGKDSQLPCHQRVNGFKDVYGRMSWSKPAPTITGGCINPSKGRFLHPEFDRAITLREAALLQTFPQSYQFPLSRGRFAVALLIGNALPPEFIRRHALALTFGRTSSV